ncbi:5'-nucleotidase C-terminal domain-containing protein [Hymenobacter psychrotolerans]|uniref:5'-nucleotidase, C-terminal domain n=1 Tax=Hymenobacter psychrotolerans DSM 18569 TaxID=1121959 RepID=A0A1M6TSM5_9BACT|nr:5'-nucleotidase C-terminal domain-containing protein [Hymenobacter psychrotolerans]SHK59916.1 5'-nucleotidase, C-terminal domain [Hymenobacter psychrotolerans DSM 18569]
MQLFRFRTAALSLLATVALFPACQRATYVAKPQLAPVTAQPVGKDLPDDATVAATIAPYRQRVTEQMAAVLGTAPVAIAKNPGESPLANFVADLQRSRASRETGQPIDLSVMTNGGLRAPLPAGSITMGSVFELMPFENELVILDAPGDVVQQLFAYAARVRMPISGGTYAVSPEGKATDIRINGQQFNPDQDRMYTIAISDYLAGGGDQLTFFKTIKPRGTGVLLRNAIADHIRELTAAGRPVEAKVDGRVK